MKLRSHLGTLVLAVLIPMIVFAVIVVALFGRQQRAAVQHGAVETARALLNATDERLHSSVKVLEALATSEHLEHADLRAFLAEARRLVGSHPDWFNVVLLTPDGQQILNTRRELGAVLPKSVEPASVNATIATRRPVIGDLVYGVLLEQYAFPVRVPVIRGGTLVYVLTAGVKPASLLEVLRRQRIPDDWVASIFDRRNTIAARTKSSEQFVGKQVSPEFVKLLQVSGAEGWAMTRTLEGVAVYTAFARSPVTGWGIGIGIPEASVNGPLYRSLLTLVAGGVALLVVALGLATIVGRRITAPIAALSTAAKTFGEGGALPDSRPAGVSEVEDVRRAFAEAATLVERRAVEAEAANRAKDEFLAVLSHELRTPLNAVYGWARMLQAGQLDATASVRALDVIVKQSNAQVQLIDDLLDVSRVITGKMRLDVRPVDLKSVVDNALDAVRPAAAAKEIRLQSALDPRAGPITGDPDRLQQVVWNLVMNAVKFTPRGGRVRVALQRVDSHVEIVVSDTGRGIEGHVLPFIFDRFRQADSSTTRAHAGLGLGLALAKHLVDLHGGSLSAHSDGEGKGATFVVTLPLAPTEGAPGRAPLGRTALPQAAPTVGADLNGVRVLLVDDDAEALELATTILAGAGAEVRASRTAAGAFEMLQQWRPDVLVSDIEMPGEDGYSLIRKVRALDPQAGGRTPAVALTAYGRRHDRTLSLTAGFSMHVPKPVDPGEFTAIVASLARPT
jgi:signal transduction histidine kinase